MVCGRMWILGILACGVLGGCREKEEVRKNPAPSVERSAPAESPVVQASYESDTKSQLSVEEALTTAPVIETLPPPIKPDDRLREELRDSIRAGADYMVRVCDKDGKFAYRVNTNPAVPIEPGYNIIRHAGAVYSLAMAYEFEPRQDVLDALLRAGTFLKREAVAPIPESDAMAAVWSDPALEGGDGSREAKLGGAGLGLVGLMGIEKIQPGFTPIEDLRKMARFLVWMQKEDGSFYCKYTPSEGGRDDSWISLYYPGEAALGLLMLYERDPSPEWFAAASRTIEYLARMRRDKSSIEADHWALLATARLLEQSAKGGIAIDDPEGALRHARQVCESILTAMPRYDTDQRSAGCMTIDGRTCPTATRLEGTLAALEFLPSQDADLRGRLTEAAHDGIAFLARTQLREGPFTGGLPRAAVPRSSRDTRATEIRIDYVQHATSAMIQYERLFNLRPAVTPSEAGDPGRYSSLSSR